MTATSTTIGFQTMPTETLMSTFALLPYTHRQHAHLRSVNKRFRTIIDSPSFRLEVAKIHFPDQAALLALTKSITREDLDSLATYELQLSRTVHTYGNYRASTLLTYIFRRHKSHSKTSEKFLSNGLRLLDYIVNVYRGSEPWKFPIILGRGILDPGHCLLLRVTIGRLYDYAIAQHEESRFDADHPISKLRNCGIPHVNNQVDEIIDLAQRRTFERAVLCTDWSSLPTKLCTPSSACLESFVRDVIFEQYAVEGEKLAASLICATPLGELLVVMDPGARNGELLEGMEWRILSRDIDLDDPAFADTRTDRGTDRLLLAEQMHQRMCDVLDEDADNNGHQAESISEVNWAEVGASIRECAKMMQQSVQQSVDQGS